MQWDLLVQCWGNRLLAVVELARSLQRLKTVRGHTRAGRAWAVIRRRLADLKIPTPAEFKVRVLMGTDKVATTMMFLDGLRRRGIQDPNVEHWIMTNAKVIHGARETYIGARCGGKEIRKATKEEVLESITH